MAGAVRTRVRIHALAGAKVPERSTPGSAGMDVSAHLPPDTYITLNPGDRIAVPTGLFFEIPHGYVISVRPRSGLSLKEGVTLANSPATIDSDYRGELKVILIHLGTKPFRIDHGDRIGQILLERVEDFDWETVSSKEELTDTHRGEGGFGSTGMA